MYLQHKKFVLKIFNWCSPRKHCERVAQIAKYCNQKCSDHFETTSPVQTLSSCNKENVDSEYISQYPIPILPTAKFKGCTRDELVEKNILLQSPDTAEEFVVLHNVRLMVFVSGRVPNFSKEQISDTLAYNWGRCAAILCNVLQVQIFVIVFPVGKIAKKTV